MTHETSKEPMDNSNNRKEREHHYVPPKEDTFMTVWLTDTYQPYNDGVSIGECISNKFRESLEKIKPTPNQTDR